MEIWSPLLGEVSVGASDWRWNVSVGAEVGPGRDARPGEPGRGKHGPVVGRVAVVGEPAQARPRRIRRHLRPRVVDHVLELVVGRHDHVVALVAGDRLPREELHARRHGPGHGQVVVGRAQVSGGAGVARVPGRELGERERRVDVVADVRPRSDDQMVRRVLVPLGPDADAVGLPDDEGGQVGRQRARVGPWVGDRVAASQRSPRRRRGVHVPRLRRPVADPGAVRRDLHLVRGGSRHRVPRDDGRIGRDARGVARPVEHAVCRVAHAEVRDRGEASVVGDRERLRVVVHVGVHGRRARVDARRVVRRHAPVVLTAPPAEASPASARWRRSCRSSRRSSRSGSSGRC